MKRNDFLKACAAGVCGCGVLGLLEPVEARPESV
ncbi:MAG: twin-arginine translocation signal domain-containing protein, partial [Candidatus Aminicenantes bacterium]|nr:twin-arginine translocation signal domain-containing protein [Candidatus Aminicenantes bacterium]